MVAFVHKLPIVLERLHLVVQHLRQFIIVPLKLLLEPFSKPIARLPDLELGLEVYKALPDKLDVEDAGHALLGFAERLELVLQERDFELGEFVPRHGTLLLVVFFFLLQLVVIEPDASLQRRL